MLDDKLLGYKTAATGLSDRELAEGLNAILRRSYLNDFIPATSVVRDIQDQYVKGLSLTMGLALTCAIQAIMEEAALRWLKHDGWEQQHYRAGYEAGERAALAFPRGEGS